jgi:hypothetical protein
MNKAQKRLHTLLTDRAIAGLEPRDRTELERLLAGGVVDPSYEAAGAAIELVLMAHAAPVPSALEAELVHEAGRYWGFAEVRPHEPTVGGQGSQEVLLGDGDDLLLGEEEPGPSFESLDDALESGVLESSLTHGHIDRVAEPRPKRDSAAHRRAERAKPKPKPDPEAEFGFDDDDDDDFEAEFGPDPEAHRRADPRSASQSDLGASASRSEVVRMPASESPVVRWVTYFSAIVALVMLAIAVWVYEHRDDPPDPEELREEVEEAEDTLEWSFVAKQDPALGEGAQGKVMWSSELQQGVALVEGITVNDPAQTQYQLWIVDKTREGAPVDAGVFDITEADGEARVALDAKLVVGEPGAFLITVERPGGVVVSAQERVLMVAAGPSAK